MATTTTNAQSAKQIIRKHRHSIYVQVAGAHDTALMKITKSQAYSLVDNFEFAGLELREVFTDNDSALFIDRHYN